MNLLAKLWADDTGAVVSTELVAVVGVLVFGVIGGLAKWRDAVLAELDKVSGIVGSVVPSQASVQAAINTPPPYAAKTLNHNQSIANAASYSHSASNVNVFVNVQQPTSRNDIPSP